MNLQFSIIISSTLYTMSCVATDLRYFPPSSNTINKSSQFTLSGRLNWVRWPCLHFCSWTQNDVLNSAVTERTMEEMFYRPLLVLLLQRSNIGWNKNSLWKYWTCTQYHHVRFNCLILQTKFLFSMFLCKGEWRNTKNLLWCKSSCYR